MSYSYENQSSALNISWRWILADLVPWLEKEQILASERLVSNPDSACGLQGSDLRAVLQQSMQIAIQMMSNLSDIGRTTQIHKVT